jgi:hypothetical protein
LPTTRGAEAVSAAVLDGEGKLRCPPVNGDSFRVLLQLGWGEDEVSEPRIGGEDRRRCPHRQWRRRRLHRVILARKLELRWSSGAVLGHEEKEGLWASHEVVGGEKRGRGKRGAMAALGALL